MNFEERENYRQYDQDFQYDETKFRRQESNSFSLYDSITVCGDLENQYFRGKCNATAWDDEELDDNIDDENEYYDDDSLESIDRPL
ncbi:hypothetical protein SAMN05443663_109151 [Flavobacterium defluvii]|uniref:Uncharacterized protein n=2 Tax=Flavobacterium defluvii TaxID=370979 RepID=A0A1M5UT95_9FLAO|nr:hypothetical protein SAMN05443663_109151 [Flavobacterium defluvii]